MRDQRNNRNFSTRDAAESFSDALSDAMRSGLSAVSRVLDAPSRTFRARQGRSDDSQFTPARRRGSKQSRRGYNASLDDPIDDSTSGGMVSPLMRPVEAALELAAETLSAFADLFGNIAGRAEPGVTDDDERTGYIEAVDRPYPSQPYQLSNCRIDAFWVDADIDKLQQISNAMFSSPTGGEVRYRIITSKLVIFLADIKAMRSTVDTSDAPWVSEYDFALWAVAVRERPSPRKLVFIPLYLFVDHGTAMAAGREVYGFPKHQVKFDGPEYQPDGPLAAVLVKALVGRNSQELGDRADDWQGILAIGGGDPSRSGNISKSDILSKLLKDFYDLESNNKRFAKAIGSFPELQKLSGPDLWMAFLKELPGADNGDKASYCSVVEAKMTINNIQSAYANGGRCELKVRDYFYVGMQKILGLKQSQQAPLTVTLQGVDLTLTPGVEIWRSAVSPKSPSS